MGWNSWDCFGASVTEAEVRANAEYMAAHLKRFGWTYIVVDIQWSEPGATAFEYSRGARLMMDRYGRLIPATNRFPTAKDGRGFRTLSDWIRSKGLKFGIHLMRGIPRQAVDARTPILGTRYTAADIADRVHVCDWNTDMYGVDMTKPGAQEYYDSVFKLFAEWGIDYVKVDDLTQPYSTAEVEAIRRAIDRSGRTMVFSGSPGETPLSCAAHAVAHLNSWRVSDDLWDEWPLLRAEFDYAAAWSPYAGPGHWPDLDMLPLGHIGIRSHAPDRRSNFTPDEQRTMMTLWCMCRSPLMMGGHLPDDGQDLDSLLTNEEVLAIHRKSSGNHEHIRRGDLIVWTARAKGGTLYVALFNVGARPLSAALPLADLGLVGERRPRDLWERRDEAPIRERISAELPPHGCRLFRLSE
jgi:hypothetical protein